jgi:hypothetical protein
LSEREHDEPFSPRERQALEAWRTPAPPEDFTARVLSSFEGERAAAPRGVRQVAVAAVAVMLVGGLLMVRLVAGGGSSLGEARALPGDGGSSAEVSPAGDGVRS